MRISCEEPFHFFFFLVLFLSIAGTLHQGLFLLLQILEVKCDIVSVSCFGRFLIEWFYLNQCYQRQGDQEQNGRKGLPGG